MVFPTVEAVVPGAGGDPSRPPAVNPFPNWEEDSEEMVGCRVRVYWDGDNEWYSGRIVLFDDSKKKPYLIRHVSHLICYVSGSVICVPY